MIDSDLTKFIGAMDAVAEGYRTDPLSDMAVKIYFRSLKQYEFEQIGAAIDAHLLDEDRGRFFPKVADLVHKLEGGKITNAQIIAAAKNPTTPLGVLARITIGSYDLNTQSEFYLNQRAEDVQALLPGWKHRASRGEYTPHELETLTKYKIDPLAPIHDGLSLPAPNDENRAKLAESSERLRLQVRQ